jgi:hypothetical protein
LAGIIQTYFILAAGEIGTSGRRACHAIAMVARIATAGPAARRIPAGGVVAAAAIANRALVDIGATYTVAFIAALTHAQTAARCIHAGSQLMTATVVGQAFIDVRTGDAIAFVAFRAGANPTTLGVCACCVRCTTTVAHRAFVDIDADSAVYPVEGRGRQIVALVSRGAWVGGAGIDVGTGISVTFVAHFARTGEIAGQVRTGCILIAAAIVERALVYIVTTGGAASRITRWAAAAGVRSGRVGADNAGGTVRSFRGTFVDIGANETIALVPCLALAFPGSWCVGATSEGAANGFTRDALVDFGAIDAIAGIAFFTSARSRTEGVRAGGIEAAATVGSRALVDIAAMDTIATEAGITLTDEAP